jgi:hypothetical protein
VREQLTVSENKTRFLKTLIVFGSKVLYRVYSITSKETVRLIICHYGKLKPHIFDWSLLYVNIECTVHFRLSVYRLFDLQSLCSVSTFIAYFVYVKHSQARALWEF